LDAGTPSTKDDAVIGTTQQYLSPYVRCMIRASTELELTEHNQPKKLELEAQLPRFWDGAEPLTATDLKSMATLMRSPDRKLGRGKKAG
jgi:hypothetical protein